MQRSAFCRSRRELSNAYLLAKFGFDTAENEASKDPMRSTVLRRGRMLSSWVVPGDERAVRDDAVSLPSTSASTLLDSALISQVFPTE